VIAVFRVLFISSSGDPRFQTLLHRVASSPEQYVSIDRAIKVFEYTTLGVL